jgi:hypothetical protein
MPIACLKSSPEYRAIAAAVAVDKLTDGILSPDEEKLQTGRMPYGWSISCAGCRVFFGLSGDVLVEISGEGCELLHAVDGLRAVVLAYKTRITRIDHATDIETDVTPKAFTDAMTRKPKTVSHICSDTGETMYIGSMKSPRYARVYRYAPPHIRSAWLRVEHVFRKQDAVEVAARWIEFGDDALAADCGKTFGWKHSVWTPESGFKIKAWRPERRDNKVHAWLTKQVAPAVSKALKENRLTSQELAQILRGSLSETQLYNLASDLLPSVAPVVDR